MVKRLFLTYDINDFQDSFFVTPSPTEGYHFIGYCPGKDAKGNIYNITFVSSGVELDSSIDYDIFTETLTFELKSNPRKTIKSVTFLTKNSKTTNRIEPNTYIAEDGSTLTADNTTIRKVCLVLPQSKK